MFKVILSPSWSQWPLSIQYASTGVSVAAPMSFLLLDNLINRHTAKIQL